MKPAGGCAPAALRRKPGWHRLFYVAVILLCFDRAEAQNPEYPPGDDVVAVFARARLGNPLRYVAIGGSITQGSGDGWVGGWLREQFPESEVTVVNAGMSATGSELGVFRIVRDVVAHQPDMVVVEFCVNDAGLSDEHAIRYMESIVVRLKSLPDPPAIVVVEAAAKGGVNLARHRLVARHYGLLEVDMQSAVDARLRESGEAWGVLFTDDVHPTKAGHALYAETMKKVLQPLVSGSRVSAAAPRSALPQPLSPKKLLLDAKMIPLQGIQAPGWKTEPCLPFWWSAFFQGILSAEEPGTVLCLPARGTAFGIFFALHESYGSFLANVDGGLPVHVFANRSRGYRASILAMDLPPREHMIGISLPAGSNVNAAMHGPVKLGYLLVAGDSEADRRNSRQGDFPPRLLRSLVFSDVPASTWNWTGPFSPASSGTEELVDAHSFLDAEFSPEPGDPRFSLSAWKWQKAEGEKGLVDFRLLCGGYSPALAYAHTTVHAPATGDVVLALDVDYFAKLWINGRLAQIVDGNHPRPLLIRAALRNGPNEIFLKVASGRAGHCFRLGVATLPPRE